MSKEFKFPTEEWQQIKLVESIAKRDEEWLAEMERFLGEFPGTDCYWCISPSQETFMNHMRQWAKGEE